MRSCLLLPFTAALGWCSTLKNVSITTLQLSVNSGWISCLWNGTALHQAGLDALEGTAGCWEVSPANLPQHLLRTRRDMAKEFEKWWLKEWLLAFLHKCLSFPSLQRLIKDRKKRGKTVAEISGCEETRVFIFWVFWKTVIMCVCPAMVPSHRAGYGSCGVYFMQR